MKILENKVALITGASRGIGFAIAKSFEKEGARLALTARQNMAALSEFKSAKAYRFDISDTGNIADLVRFVIRDFGRIDVLVNNAAIFKQVEFEEVTPRELTDIITADFEGVFLLSQAVFKQMKLQNGGKIVNIASVAAKLASGRASVYASSKAALISLTKSTAKLGGKFNINVNAVAPGFIATDMTKDMFQLRRQAIEAAIPFGRTGEPSDVAGVVLFLASQGSNYITGQTICVDGGFCTV